MNSAFSREKKHKEFVETVSDYAIKGEDFDAIHDDGIRTLFRDQEYDELILRLRVELLPRLDDVREHWEFNYDGDSPEGLGNFDS